MKSMSREKHVTWHVFPFFSITSCLEPVMEAFQRGWSSGLWVLHEFCLKILRFKKNLRVLESKPMDNLLPTPLDTLVQ